MEEREKLRCSDSKWQFKRAIFQEGEKPAPPPPAPPAEGGPSAVHFDFLRCLQTCCLQWFVVVTPISIWTWSGAAGAAGAAASVAGAYGSAPPSIFKKKHLNVQNDLVSSAHGLEAIFS